MKDLVEIFNRCFTLKDVCIEYYGKFSSHKQRLLIKDLKQIGLNVSDIKERYRLSKLKPRYNKECPVCKTIFKVTEDDSKITCSYSCSNTYFNGTKRNKNLSQYRTIAFKFHEKICIVCGEDKIVEVHHYDENKNNNQINNLIPLCPTHHQYYHSKYKYLVVDIIEEFRKGLTGCSSTVEQ